MRFLVVTNTIGVSQKFLNAANIGELQKSGVALGLPLYPCEKLLLMSLDLDSFGKYTPT